MLGGEFIGEGYSLLQLANQNKLRIPQGEAELVPSPRETNLPPERSSYGIEHAARVGQEDCDTAFPVLRLGEQVGCDPVRLGRFISDDKDFTWAREKVDANSSKTLSFRFDDKGVARAKNFVHRRDCRGAEGKCSDSLRASETINFGGAAFG